MSDVFLFKLLDLYKKFSTKCKLTYLESRQNILEIIQFKIKAKGAVIGAVALSTQKIDKASKKTTKLKGKEEETTLIYLTTRWMRDFDVFFGMRKGFHFITRKTFNMHVPSFHVYQLFVFA